jgi:hypothetical protein
MVEMEITTPTRALVLELSDHLIDNVQQLTPKSHFPSHVQQLIRVSVPLTPNDVYRAQGFILPQWKI